jgi:hypothetical protein
VLNGHLSQTLVCNEKVISSGSNTDCLLSIVIDKHTNTNEPMDELHWLRAVFLAAMGAEDAQIVASFREAIRIAKEQKSVSLEKRAEGTYAEYRRQKASGSGGRGFRLPLW